MNTTSYRPSSNPVERFHQPLAEYVKQFIDGIEEWDSWLSLATFCHNTSVHESTGHTPFELVFGRLARTPSTRQLEHEDLLPTYDNYIHDLVTRLNKLQTMAKDRLIASKERNKHYYDQKVNPQTFNLFDSVFLLKGGKIHKHEDQYTGPYKIIETYPDGNVKIEISPTKFQVVHCNRLKKSHIDPVDKSNGVVNLPPK